MEIASIKKNNKINPDTETSFKASEVDKFPEYPGGIKKFYVYAQKNFIIPKEIKEKKIKGYSRMQKSQLISSIAAN